MLLNRQDEKLMDVCFNNNLVLLFERGSSYDNIIIKGIPIASNFEDVENKKHKKMLIDMQNNIFCDTDLKEYMSKNFNDYDVYKTMENLSHEKVQLIYKRRV